MFVKPGPHPERKDAQRKVRIPHTHALLKDEGEDVPETRFWLRRLRAGDVVKAEPPKPAPAEPAEAPHPEAAPAPAPAGHS